MMVGIEMDYNMAKRINVGYCVQDSFWMPLYAWNKIS